MIYYVYTMHQRLQSVILLLTAIYFSQSNANCDCGKFTPAALHMSQNQTLLGNNAKIYMGSNSPNNLRYPWWYGICNIICTGGPRIVRKSVQKFLCAIWNCTIWIYNRLSAENRTIARNRTNFSIKSNTWDQKIFHTIVKPHCLNLHYSRTLCRYIMLIIERRWSDP